MKRVLVLDANQRSALAVTRSLGRRGIPVFTAEENPAALAGFSRFSIQHFEYPSPRLEPERFVDVVAGLASDQRIDILLPMTELTTMLLLAHKSCFPRSVIPFPEMTTVEALANKCSLMRLAESHGVPIPRTLYVDNAADVPAALGQQMDYPAVLKPAKSWILDQREWSRVSVRFASNNLELQEIITSNPAFHGNPFMIQECVQGEGQGVFALYDRGEALAFFAHRRLREKPPSGGVSVVSESVAVNPELGQHARTLLDAVRWHGIAMVEFKVAADKTPYLMEINTRFWGSLQLAIDAGVDFPYLLYQLACGERPEPVSRYKTGTRLRWLLGDLDSLYLTLRDRKCPLRSKARALLRFLTPAPFTTRHEVNRWGDLGPFWHELRQYLGDIFR